MICKLRQTQIIGKNAQKFAQGEILNLLQCLDGSLLRPQSLFLTEHIPTTWQQNWMSGFNTEMRNIRVPNWEVNESGEKKVSADFKSTLKRKTKEIDWCLEGH